MTEQEKSIKSTTDYICCDEDFRLKDPQSAPLKKSNDRFRFVELVQRSKKKGKEEDTSDYVRFQLSPIGRLFGEQVDYFVQTGIHPSIAQFEGFELYPQHLAITKYYPNGSLQHLLKEIGEGKQHQEWNGTMKSKCAYGLVAAVKYIHNIFDKKKENFSIHYLCPENIIFDEKNEPKLINYVFGNEKLGKIPNAYIPPELYQYSIGHRQYEDTWDVGMILYEILTGKVPYNGMKEEQIKNEIINGNLPEFPPQSSDTDVIVGIIKKCLSKNPEDRPLPSALYDELSSLSEPLFPGTDKEEYENYRKMIKDATD